MAAKRKKARASNAVDYDLQVKVLHYYYKMGMKLEDVAKKVHRSVSATGKIKKSAEEKYLITIINAPRKTEKIVELQKALGIDKEDSVMLVNNGIGKNSEHLGYAAGKYLCELIVDILEKKSRINIGVSCGETIRFSCKRLVEELHDNNVDLSGKIINIFPSALIGGYSFSTIIPAFTASRLADRLLSLPEHYRPVVNCKRSLLPPPIYDPKTPSHHKEILTKYCGYHNILPHPVKTLDILLTGIGRAMDKEYREACKQSGIIINRKDLTEDTPEINFSPVDSNGILPKYKGVISGITIDQMRKMAKLKNKHVIALIGGKDKREAAKIVFKNPHFNTLFTDHDISDHWLRATHSIR
jgi:DNA-binding transcriptional regulator LsrR (DeoR family)